MTFEMIRKGGVSLLCSISSNTRLDLWAALCTDWDVESDRESLQLTRVMPIGVDSLTLAFALSRSAASCPRFVPTSESTESVYKTFF